MEDKEKLFYTIGDVSQLLEVKPYVLRYWESEFKKLNPQKSQTGQRTYRKKDIQVALAIKKLLYEEKYTIAGAIQRLEEIEKTGFESIPIPKQEKSAEPTPEESAPSVPEVPALPDQASFAPPENLEAAGNRSNNLQTDKGTLPEPVSPVKTPSTPDPRIAELQNLMIETKRIFQKYEPTQP